MQQAVTGSVHFAHHKDLRPPHAKLCVARPAVLGRSEGRGTGIVCDLAGGGGTARAG